MTRLVMFGPSDGYSSIATVARGMAEGLLDNGALAGYVPYGQGQPPAGDGAVFVGPYTMVHQVYGQQYSKVYLWCAPNSTWLPRRLFDAVPENVVLLSPSRWGAAMIEHNCRRLGVKRKTSVCLHGVSSKFVEYDDLASLTVEAFDKGNFDCLHLTSTTGERKGTDKLIRAWPGVLEVVPKATLHIVANDELLRMHELLSELEVPPERYTLSSRLDGAPVEMAALYGSSHIVVQPSRGEAFGLVPLEAKACGVPVVMTACTGHVEQIEQSLDKEGTVVVKQPPGLAPIDDGPGALAPMVEPSAIIEAILEAHEGWKELKKRAMERAPFVRQNWSWGKTVGKWLESEAERG